MSQNKIVIRSAIEKDMIDVASMIQELADFEKMSNGPKLTAGDLLRDAFKVNPPLFQCLVAEISDDALAKNSKVIGYAIYFNTYSTWEGKSMMLEDIYVRMDERKKGVGQRLFQEVAKIAQETGCCRLDFHVLKWNDARMFYEKNGALNLTENEEWCYYRLKLNKLG